MLIVILAFTSLSLFCGVFFTVMMKFGLQCQKLRKENLAFRKDLQKTKKGKFEEHNHFFHFINQQMIELRRPIHTMLGFSDLIEHDQPYKREDFGTFSSCLQTLANQIDKIHVFSEVQTGNVQKKSNALVTLDFLRPLLTDIHFKSNQKELDFSYTASGEIPREIETDQYLLKALLSNVLENAIHFTQEGSIEIKINGFQNSSGRHELEFNIQDTGKGMSKQDFEIFFGENLEENTWLSDSRIGLSICHSIIQKLKGTLWAESEPGKGSSIFLRVPVSTFDLNTDPPEPLELKDGLFVDHILNDTLMNQPLTMDYSELKVLCVDDEPLAGKVIVEMLKKLDVQADLVNSGNLAIEATQDHQYDLVFMDIQMPEMDGWVTAERIKETWKHKENFNVIALTSHARKQDYERSAQIGFFDHLSKPLSLSELKQIIYTFVRHSTPRLKPTPTEEMEEELETELSNDIVATETDSLENSSQDTEEEQTEIVAKEPDLIEDEVLNQNTLQERFDGDQELIQRMLEMAVTSFNDHFPILAEAINDEDFNTVAEQAHGLRGVFASISHESGTAICTEIEELAGDKDFSMIPVLFDKLEEEGNKLTQLLKENAEATPEEETSKAA